MAQERLFTEEKLKELGMRTVDRLEQSIDAGNTEEAKKLAHLMYREFLAMHDLLVDWIAALLTFIGKNHGDKELYAALEAGVAAWLEPAAKLYEGQDVKRRLQLAAAGMADPPPESAASLGLVFRHDNGPFGRTVRRQFKSHIVCGPGLFVVVNRFTQKAGS